MAEAPRWCKKFSSSSVVGATVGIGTDGEVPAGIGADINFAAAGVGVVREGGTAGVSVHVLGHVRRMSANGPDVHHMPVGPGVRHKSANGRGARLVLVSGRGARLMPVNGPGQDALAAAVVAAAVGVVVAAEAVAVAAVVAAAETADGAPA